MRGLSGQILTMGQNKLLEDLLGVIKDHGLKADDAGEEETKPAETESENGEGAATEEAPKDAKNDDSKVAADLAQGIIDKLTEAITKNTGREEKATKKAVEHEVRSKIFTNYHGLKEITYPSNLANLTKEEKIVNFFKALVYHRTDEQSQRVLRALVEGTDSEGGYLVPEELRTEVFRVLPDMSVMRRLAMVIPMSTDTLKLNSLSARPVAYWTAEYASKSTTSAEFSQVSLSPNDLVCLLPVSEQLLADANINLVQFIITLFAEAIAEAEDRAFFTGSGTGQPKGINQETLTTVTAGGTGDMDDILDLIDSVPQRVAQSPKAAFVGNRRTKTLLRKVKDSNGNYIWRDGGAAPSSVGETARLPDTLYGYPFWEQNHLANGDIYFGDWSFYIIGDRQAVSVRTTTEGGDAWRRNSMEIKAVERVDGKAVITSPFAKITGF